MVQQPPPPQRLQRPPTSRIRDPLPNTDQPGYPHPSQLIRPPRNSARFSPACTDLRGADLRGADLRGADLRGALLKCTQNLSWRCGDVPQPDRDIVDLRGADLRGADLRGIVGMTEQEIRHQARVDSKTRF
ncbi:pentapeptide repeat-containing protein [Microbispora rosea]|uniref:pentapeptide repeat-containing protein n=1 Tax=Microbispora rosea TaxID=58117 RepID=UPI003680F80B